METEDAPTVPGRLEESPADSALEKVWNSSPHIGSRDLAESGSGRSDGRQIFDAIAQRELTRPLFTPPSSLPRQLKRSAADQLAAADKSRRRHATADAGKTPAGKPPAGEPPAQVTGSRPQAM